jgi:hypothetical protein
MPAALGGRMFSVALWKKAQMMEVSEQEIQWKLRKWDLQQQ